MEHVVDQFLASVKITDSETSGTGEKFQTGPLLFKIWILGVDINQVHGIKLLTHQLFLFSTINEILNVLRLLSHSFPRVQE
jgi:hypothetical protein